MNDNQVNLHFTKMQAQGNSYIFFDFLEKSPPVFDIPKFAISVSDKNFGVGADGIVFLLPDTESDAHLRIWNADGSEAETCGSALRSVMALLYKKSNDSKKNYSIKTAAGIVNGTVVYLDDKYEVSIAVNNIQTILYGHTKDVDPIENLINVDKWIGLPVSVGNPHFVVIDRFQEYGADITNTDLIQRIGPDITQDATFKEGINLELVKIINPRKVAVRVWERGTGETLACGTGACAAVYAGFHLGFLDTEVTVIFPGGRVTVNLNHQENSCRLLGSVGFVFEGQLNPNDILKC
ncbi:MAG: diaminopimelate epimerase [Candidatus Cloacimonetes bacterium]|nr:diaminopimelate epimerase [Candidatus Cloacimonadota bacterium]